MWAIALVTANAGVYYVSPDGDNSDGLSWGTAFHSLLDAQAKVTAPAEIWVKQGTYSVADTTLTILNNVNVYGGFAGNETSLDARNADPSLTVLNGNQKKRVLTSASNLTVETIWDGFTIQNGYDGNAGGVSLLKNATLRNCIIQKNKNATNNGGGVYMATNATDSVKLINCTVKENTVYYKGTGTDPAGGGGVYIHSGSVAAIVRNCVIENNMINGEGFTSARMYGGGLFMSAGTVENTIVSGNRSTSLDPEDNSFKNLGETYGGGIMVLTPASGNVAVRNCIVKGNRAEVKSGGGITIDPHYTSTVINGKVTVENTIVADNYARVQGGGAFCRAQKAESTAEYSFINCVIANNEVQTNEGGAAFIQNAPTSVTRFVNSTIVNNWASSSYGGGGIFYNASSVAEVTNCLFWGNLNAHSSGTKHHLRLIATATNTISYCAFDKRFVQSQIESATTTFDGLLSVENDNTSAATGNYVKFVSPTTFTGTAKTDEQRAEIAAANWSLANGSACIDAGATVRTLAYDLAGTERPVGEGYDIGAYEYAPTNAINAPNTNGVTGIYGVSGGVIVDRETPARVFIYNITGALYTSTIAAPGQHFVAVAIPGVYIVKIGDRAVKTVVK
jgi:hypothetical protein